MTTWTEIAIAVVGVVVVIGAIYFLTWHEYNDLG